MADFLNITEVLSHLNLQDTMMACEFGCGSADFAIALAKKLKRGNVVAIDIQEEKLSALKSNLSLKGISNISLVLGDLEAPEGSTLKEKSQDVVVIPNVLFQVDNKYAIIQEGVRVLKVGGELLIIDWLSGAPFGPKEGVLTQEQAKTFAGKLKLSLKKEFAAGDYHYALVFVKLS